MPRGGSDKKIREKASDFDFDEFDLPLMFVSKCNKVYLSSVEFNDNYEYE